MLKHHRTLFFLYVRDQVSYRTMCKIMVVNRDNLQKCAVCSNITVGGLIFMKCTLTGPTGICKHIPCTLSA
jgi:recombinational DNA repair protein RecR